MDPYSAAKALVHLLSQKCEFDKPLPLCGLFWAIRGIQYMFHNAQHYKNGEYARTCRFSFFTQNAIGQSIANTQSAILQSIKGGVHVNRAINVGTWVRGYVGEEVRISKLR